MHDMNDIVGTHDLVLITLDTLRYDVAQALWREGRTPNLAALLGESGWEHRHTPGNFTLAAHQAFFSGFMPTPSAPGPHPRLFAADFQGSETTTDNTWVFEQPTLPEGLAAIGYHTICVGGVGFFNKRTAIGRVLPDLFAESHWSPQLGVTDPASTAQQFELAARRLGELSPGERVFLFINVSAIHQPNCHYVDGQQRDDLHTHAAALEYVDGVLPTLLDALWERAPTFGIVCADHGTAYGEDGYWGHRLNHPTVLDVPYAEFILDQTHRTETTP
jgi:hypothetical protein